MKELIAATTNFQGMSAKNDSLLQIEERVRIYASGNSTYLDRNVQWVLFILAEYILSQLMCVNFELVQKRKQKRVART